MIRFVGMSLFLPQTSGNCLKMELEGEQDIWWKTNETRLLYLKCADGDRLKCQTLEEGEGVLSIVEYMGRLHPKGYLFRGCRYIKVQIFHELDYR